MSQFQDYFTNPEYISGFNAIREHDISARETGIVYVEDSSDIAFWKRFVSRVFPNPYRFQTASQTTTGKRALEALYGGANIQAIIAVDSDYDYIKASYQSEHYFNQNPFILHTFGFSRESALIEQHSLHEFIKKCEYTVSHQVNISDFINQFSQLAWYGLVRFIHRLSNSTHQDQIESDIYNNFHQCFNITNQTLVTEELEIKSDSLDIIKNNFLELFDRESLLETDLESTKEILHNLGINEQNAYRFICGHTLYNVIYKVHKQLLEQLRKLEEAKLRGQFTGKVIKERINQLNKVFYPQSSLETFFNNYFINDNDEIHERILSRIQSLHAQSLMDEVL